MNKMRVANSNSDRDSRRHYFARVTSLEAAPIMDWSALMVLLENGATPQRLAILCQNFYQSVEQALAEIAALPLDDGRMAAVAHRTRSACATVGARALVSDLQALAGCVDVRAAEAHFSKMGGTFVSTKQAVDAFLGELIAA
jgi:HPt (histidine-containing phosphotransfer) domain-containing protein